MGDGRAVAPQRAPLSGAVPDDSHVPRPANHRGECRQPRILGKRLHSQDTDLRQGVDPENRLCITHRVVPLASAGQALPSGSDGRSLAPLSRQALQT